MYSVSGICEATRNMEAENAGSKSEDNALDSEALTRESSQSTHGTGTGLYTLGYLLDRHLNRMFMLARAASMVPFPSVLAAAERKLL